MILKFSNYGKPSDPKLKLIGDIALYSIPLYLPIILSLPIPDLVKAWLSPLFTAILATIKIITKFTLDPNYVEPTSDSTEDTK